jgi:AraC-like DNA-binding protein
VPQVDDLLLLRHLLLASARAQPQPRVRTPLRGKLVIALRYIRTNYRQAPTVRQVAEVAGLSPYHFQRTFTQHVGRTVKQTITRLQIREAKRLLLAGVRPGEIPQKVGFAHAAHFCWRFKKETGLSPTRWVEHWRDNRAPCSLSPWRDRAGVRGKQGSSRTA